MKLMRHLYSEHYCFHYFQSPVFFYMPAKMMMTMTDVVAGDGHYLNCLYYHVVWINCHCHLLCWNLHPHLHHHLRSPYNQWTVGDSTDVAVDDGGDEDLLNDASGGDDLLVVGIC